jgi:lon-related putative ATP-dependent protease
VTQSRSKPPVRISSRPNRVAKLALNRSFALIPEVQPDVSGDAQPTKLPAKSLQKFMVSPDDLRWVCDASLLPFKTTAEVRPTNRVLGQQKAARALELGMNMKSAGYNIFLCGIPGTGRRSLLRRALKKRHASPRPLEDLIYVPRFDALDRPRLVRLPAGESRGLRKDIRGLFRQLARVRDKSSESSGLDRIKRLVARRIHVLQERYESLTQLGSYFVDLAREIVMREGDVFEEDFGIQVVVERRPNQKVPVVWPTHLNFSGLFGSFEKVRGDEKRPAGVPVGSIRAGALVEAHCGFLVLSASEFLESPGAWSTLKNSLLAGSVDLFDHEGQQPYGGSGFRPDPIPINTKVVIVGDYTSYDTFLDLDPDFCQTFKIRVDFDTEVPLRKKVISADYPGVISRIVREEKLRHLTRSAVAKVVEFGVRKAGRKSKISVQFSAIADLIRESDYWARVDGRRTISEKQIARALSECVDRLNLLETKLSEMISEGVILIDTVGSRVGQVNGLAVYDQGDYLFGKPSRITAETSMGHSGIINIERESGLSGRSHDKGIQILGGYLRSRFAQERPLSLTASVCFEQSYQSMDGDSASATEIYAILSSLSGLPIRQDVAVTGSLNQKGDIQPIGGVNEKIEGFYDCVMAGRRTGREGVVIPHRNLSDLMLREDVVKAVRARKFFIYAIDTVEEGIEILTGCRAGKQRSDGSFPSGTIFYLVDQRLDDIANGLREFPSGPR